MFCIRLYQEVCLRLLGLRKVEEMNELKNVHMLCVMHSSVLLLYLDSTVLYYYCGTIVVHVCTLLWFMCSTYGRQVTHVKM
jgi:hypothetical protein